MAKVKNIGSEYVSGDVSVAPGEVAEVSAEKAAYLLSSDCPGKFEAVEDDKPKAKGGK